eukprot:TRINITY_DN6768_c0_g1_i3.p1 TRINITY_DN6768_c0_g1~~TRINITY_DN6768_c0_g1_i3.p1  ORF type:complete len:556 (+),score=97.78 TRINITY_DN6768_c0_g1_i3:57-1724(+)
MQQTSSGLPHADPMAVASMQQAYMHQQQHAYMQQAYMQQQHYMHHVAAQQAADHAAWQQAAYMHHHQMAAHTAAVQNANAAAYAQAQAHAQAQAQAAARSQANSHASGKLPRLGDHRHQHTPPHRRSRGPRSSSDRGSVVPLSEAHIQEMTTLLEAHDGVMDGGMLTGMNQFRHVKRSAIEEVFRVRSGPGGKFTVHLHAEQVGLSETSKRPRLTDGGQSEKLAALKDVEEKLPKADEGEEAPTKVPINSVFPDGVFPGPPPGSPPSGDAPDIKQHPTDQEQARSENSVAIDGVELRQEGNRHEADTVSAAVTTPAVQADKARSENSVAIDGLELSQDCSRHEADTVSAAVTTPAVQADKARSKSPTVKPEVAAIDGVVLAQDLSRNEVETASAAVTTSAVRAKEKMQPAGDGGTPAAVHDQVGERIENDEEVTKLVQQREENDPSEKLAEEKGNASRSQEAQTTAEGRSQRQQQQEQTAAPMTAIPDESCQDQASVCVPAVSVESYQSRQDDSHPLAVDLADTGGSDATDTAAFAAVPRGSADLDASEAARSPV